MVDRSYHVCYYVRSMP